MTLKEGDVFENPNGLWELFLIDENEITVRQLDENRPDYEQLSTMTIDDAKYFINKTIETSRIPYLKKARIQYYEIHDDPCEELFTIGKTYEDIRGFWMIIHIEGENIILLQTQESNPIYGEQYLTSKYELIRVIRYIKETGRRNICICGETLGYSEDLDWD